MTMIEAAWRSLLSVLLFIAGGAALVYGLISINHLIGDTASLILALFLLCWIIFYQYWRVQ